MAHLLLVGPRPIAITVWLVRDHSLLYATALDDTGTCFIHFFLWDAWVRYQNYNNHICRSNNFQMSNETFRNLPPQKKKAVKVLGDFPAGWKCLFIFPLEVFPTFFPFSRFSASGGFPFSRLQELIEILDFGPKRGEKPKEAGFSQFNCKFNQT